MVIDGTGRKRVEEFEILNQDEIKDYSGS